MQVYRGRIISYISENEIKDLFGYMGVDNGKIVYVSERKPENLEFVDYSNFLILPGFVDTHTHLSQVDIRGRWNYNLLDWLEKYVFPEEEKFDDDNIARDKAERFFKELIRNGTTTSMIFSSSFKRATDIAFEIGKNMGLRFGMGQVLMDRYAPENLLTNPDIAERDILELAKKWNGLEDRIFYAITPRFAVSCSMNLMKRVGNIARKLDLYIQTHISEQEEEIKIVREKYGKDYAQVYDDAGILGKKTILAHGVHLSEKELEIIAKRDVRIAHCPASNFFLHSGRMNLEKIEKWKIKVSLGSDIAGAPYLSMLNVMRDACYTNKIAPRKAFYMATLGGAKALGMSKKIGSISMGKYADFIVVDLRNLANIDDSVDDILSQLIFRGDERNIFATYVNGNKLYERKN